MILKSLTVSKSAVFYFEVPCGASFQGSDTFFLSECKNPTMTAGFFILFHSDGFSEVSGHIDVGFAEDGGMIREKLASGHGGDGKDYLVVGTERNYQRGIIITAEA